jgi:murein L,D-transpeptidase YcbB/YkuD
MNWVSVAFKLFSNRDELLRLYEMLQPALKEIIKVAPRAVPLGKQLVGDIFPEFAMQEEVVFDVKWLQNALNKLGEDLEVDGDYGKLTKEAVKRYQERRGLEVDGWAGIKTTADIYGELKSKGLER